MIPFGKWMGATAPRWVYEASARKNAWEYGARAELAFGMDHGPIYHRSDCRRAEAEGRAAARAAVAAGLSITCPCCSRISEACMPGRFA